MASPPHIAAALLSCLLVSACGAQQARNLPIERIVLYQSGVAYVERVGQVDGDLLTMTVRPDQINDLLGSLAVRDDSGSTVTVSFPVEATRDPRMPGLPDHAVGSGGIGALLEAFRGATVRASTATTSTRGRIVSIETIDGGQRLTLYTSSSELVSFRVSDLERVEIVSDGLALALERALDRRLADGDWKAVDISIRFSDRRRRLVSVSYVLEAPIWKPAYRAMVDDTGFRLQGWAVVDNVSGDDWTDVRLSLTSGTPISFRYDLHAPVFVDRPDLSGYNTPTLADLRPPTPMRSTPAAPAGRGTAVAQAAPRRPAAMERSAPAPAPSPMWGAADAEAEGAWDDFSDEYIDGAVMPFAESSAQRAEVVELGALYRYDIPGRVRLPDQTSTLVSLIDERMDGDDTLVFQPGAGAASSVYPYRAIRFTNASPAPLEPAPITIYRQGAFVGEGLLPAVSPGERAFVPYALERRVQVQQRASSRSGDVVLRRIVRGRITVERESHDITAVEIASSLDSPETVYVRIPRSQNAELVAPPAGVETQADHWLVPLTVTSAGRSEFEVIRRTRRPETIGLEDPRAQSVLSVFLARPDLRPDLAAGLQPVLTRLERIAEIQSRTQELQQLRGEVQNRTNELRRNLQTLGTTGDAAQLRTTLIARLDEQEAISSRIATELVALSEESATLRVEATEILRAVEFDEP